MRAVWTGGRAGLLSAALSKVSEITRGKFISAVGVGSGWLLGFMDGFENG